MWQDSTKTKSEQIFYAPDGSTTVTGHVSYFFDADTQVNDSFDIDGNTWVPRRTYTWRRAE